jgi:hypothetical protein
MSCTNPNCNSGCGCNGCCPPVTPPTPPTPPTCSGEDCVEIYDAGCVNYTGPNIDCFGIRTGYSLNAIIQSIANTMCACAAGPECVNPITILISRSLEIYNSLTASHPTETWSYSNILKSILDQGIITRKCKYCCPDAAAYGLFFNAEMYSDVVTHFGSEVPCLNCATNYQTCHDQLLVAINSEDVIPYELGTIDSSSVLCEIVSQFKDLDEVFIKNFIDSVNEKGLLIKCDLNNGEIFIGSYNTYKNYYLK